MSVQLNFVIPGWYKYRHNNGDSIQTIRVLGEGDRGPNYFKLMDGNEMRESEILDDWEYMPTAITQDVHKENFNLGNLESIHKHQDNIHKEITIDKSIISEPKHEELIVSNHTTINHSKQIKKISDEEIFVNQLLKQISVSKNKEQFGEVQFKSTFEIPIQFNFNYDLTKLKQILHLIDDKSQIDLFIQKIISNDLIDIQQKINESIKNFLLNDDKSPEDLVRPNQLNQSKPRHLQSNIQVSDYLSNF